MLVLESYSQSLPNVASAWLLVREFLNVERQCLLLLA